MLSLKIMFLLHVICVRWENMLGRYKFLYQLEILQEQAEISKLKNITLSSALPPHIRRRSCKGVFHIAQIWATFKVQSYPERLCCTSAHPDCRDQPWTEIQVEVYGQRGKSPFCQHSAVNIKIINIFLLHSDPFRYSKDKSSSIFQLHYVSARHYCSHDSKWKSDLPIPRLWGTYLSPD